MNREIRLITATVLLALLAGCSSSEYIISTTGGTMIATKGQPRLNEKTGMYTYKDDEGRAATIKKDDVKQIMER